MYRLIWPATALRNAGHDVRVVLPAQREGIGGDIDTRTNTLKNVRLPADADVIVLQRVAFEHMAQAVPMIRARGVAVVVDMDDDLTKIDPSQSGLLGAAHRRGRADGPPQLPQRARRLPGRDAGHRVHAGAAQGLRAARAWRGHREPHPGRLSRHPAPGQPGDRLAGLGALPPGRPAPAGPGRPAPRPRGRLVLGRRAQLRRARGRRRAASRTGPSGRPADVGPGQHGRVPASRGRDRGGHRAAGADRLQPREVSGCGDAYCHRSWHLAHRRYRPWRSGLAW